jgi:hypothetical protein
VRVLIAGKDVAVTKNSSTARQSAETQSAAASTKTAGLNAPVSQFRPKSIEPEAMPSGMQAGRSDEPLGYHDAVDRPAY